MTVLPEHFQQQVTPVQPPALAPGRVIERTVRRPLRSGRIVQLTYHEATSLDQTANLGTLILTEITPALDDGLIPQDISDIAECSLCQGLVVARLHAVICQGGCGRTICTRCINQKHSNECGAFVCRECASPWVVQVLKKLFMGK